MKHLALRVWPEYVSVKFRDRDGSVVEAAWEPDHTG
jgi:hypothetical protein